MKKLFNKLFGGKKSGDATMNLTGDTLQKLIDKAGYDISFDLGRTEKGLHIDLFGKDEAIFVEREGQLLDSIQLFLKRTVQHRNPEERVGIVVDCDGYRDRADDELKNLADKLKGIVVSKGKPVYFRALAPRDRKVVHQHLSDDARIQSRSVGDGLYKKIKIFPAKAQNQKRAQS